MVFYPDEDSGDDIEIENKYDLNANSGEESDDDSDILLVKNNREKKELVSGIDHKELKKRIENFTLNNNQEEEIVTENEGSISNIQNLEIKKNIELKEEKSNNLEEDIPLEKAELKNIKKKRGGSNETLNWYMKISGLPIFFIILYSFLVLGRRYFATVSSNLTNFAQSIYWLDNLKWPFEILVFLLTTYVVIKKKNQLPRIAGIVCTIVGFSAGVIIAVIKLFWYREMWNIFYLSAEGIFLGITGLVVGLLSAALFYDEYE